jgi:glyoxylase-like metal-dependent hydrolase (beta-lactamase superfamily II)
VHYTGDQAPTEYGDVFFSTIPEAAGLRFEGESTSSRLQTAFAQSIFAHIMNDNRLFFLERIAVGPIETNCYLFGCSETRQAVIIDPGDEPERICALVHLHQAEISALVLTHGHYDHLGGVGDLRRKFSCPVMIHKAEAETLTDPRANMSFLLGAGVALDPAERLLEDGDTVAVGNLTLSVIHTPGHSPGGICLHWEKILFGGDLLFMMSIGRTDLPGGSFQQLENSIRTKVYTLPDDTLVYPGHGEKTTVGFEKKNNQFVPET